MITLLMPPESIAKCQRDSALAAGFGAAVARAMQGSLRAGAEVMRAGVQTGEFGVTAQQGEAGLAGAIQGWTLDASANLYALGVPSGSTAIAYAHKLNVGGVILPKNAKTLAIPMSAEAKAHASPREMPGLVLIAQRGRPALLAEDVPARGRRKGGLVVHWVLLSSVTMPARAVGWFDRAAAKAGGYIVNQFRALMGEYLKGGQQAAGNGQPGAAGGGGPTMGQESPGGPQA